MMPNNNDDRPQLIHKISILKRKTDKTLKLANENGTKIKLATNEIR